jgi:hypothetical protein
MERRRRSTHKLEGLLHIAHLLKRGDVVESDYREAML